MHQDIIAVRCVRSKLTAVLFLGPGRDNVIVDPDSSHGGDDGWRVRCVPSDSVSWIMSLGEMFYKGTVARVQ
jgi:hypothetical protein